MKKIKNRIYRGNEEYKFKLWEKILIAIITPIALFLGAPLSILFFIFSAVIMVSALGAFGFFLLMLISLVMRSLTYCSHILVKLKYNNNPNTKMCSDKNEFA